MQMNTLDFILILIVLFSALTGWQRGFALSLLDLVRWVGSLVLGFSLYPYLADWLRSHTDWGEYWIPAVSFFSIAILSSILIQALGSFLLGRLSGELHGHRVNKLLGIVPGLASGVITAAILSILLLAIPLSEGMDRRVQESRLASKLGVYADLVEARLAPAFDQAAERTLRRPALAPESDQFIELPFKVSTYKPRPDLEARMLELVNRERAARGLQPLAADASLTAVARRHSADMFRRGYFSHFSPEGASAADRVREANIPYRTVGENLALAPTLTVAHKGLMDSPGHRANILNKRFGRVGIGVLEGGRHGLMITQNFRN